MNGKKGLNALYTPQFDNRNYELNIYSIEPQLTYIQGTSFQDGQQDINLTIKRTCRCMVEKNQFLIHSTWNLNTIFFKTVLLPANLPLIILTIIPRPIQRSAISCWMDCCPERIFSGLLRFYQTIA